jgi:CubicO group peptidase (beta-lactamase class C family)
MCSKIADSRAATAPGETVEYHALTFGWILGELVRRIDSRDFSRFMHDEICSPLGIETMFCGLPDELHAAVAVLEEPNFQPVEGQAPDAPQSVPSWIQPLANWMNDPRVRSICQPASNGIMNARAIARHYAALLPGGVDGVELLTPSRVQEACISSSEIPGFGLGYQIGILDPSTRPSVFGHCGHGGSVGAANPANGWALGFTRNRFVESETLSDVVKILIEILSR